MSGEAMRADFLGRPLLAGKFLTGSDTGSQERGQQPSYSSFQRVSGLAGIGLPRSHIRGRIPLYAASRCNGSHSASHRLVTAPGLPVSALILDISDAFGLRPYHRQAWADAPLNWSVWGLKWAKLGDVVSRTVSNPSRQTSGT